MNFDFKNDPFDNFLKSYKMAESRGIPDSNAMALATVDNGKPFNRIVLYKGLVDEGFSFFTHYDKKKGLQLEKNPHVAATFFWSTLDHQIRIQGFVEKLTVQQSDAYFSSRPRMSQIGAWVSKQSEELNSFDEFNELIYKKQKEFAEQVISRPPNWGGYKIIPLEIEFWFSKKGRLHERYVYHRSSVNEPWSRFFRFP